MMRIVDFFKKKNMSNNSIHSEPQMVTQALNRSDDTMWSLINCEIGFDTSPYNGPETIANNFYIGAAVCSYCNRPMFKTVFPMGDEYPITTTVGNVKIKRVFTCPSCGVFIAPVPGYSVSDGKVFENKKLNADNYVGLLRHMDNCGSLSGRADL
jgi:hypothetical protein